MALSTRLITQGTGPEAVSFDDSAQVVKLEYGAESAHTLMDEKPATEARQPELIDENPAADTPATPVRQAPLRVHSISFSEVGSGLLSPQLQQIGTTGSGMTVSQSSGNLVIAAGTTARSEFLARSLVTIDGAHHMRWGFVASQRIANNNFAVMLADIIGEGLAFNIVSATVVDVTKTAHGFTEQNVGQFMNLGAINSSTCVPGRYAIASIPDANTIRFTVSGWPASGTGALCLFGWNYHRVLYTGTTATNASYDSQRNGWASGDTTATINTSASPGHIGAMQSDCSDAQFCDALRASNTGYQFTTRATRIEKLPDQDRPMYMFVWSFNGSTAPASSTTWTINFLRLEDLHNQKVYIAGATRGGTGNAVPVYINGSTTLGVSGSTVTNVPSTSQGSSTGHRAAITANITTGQPTSVKASAGVIGTGCVSNNSGTGVWFHLYDKASAPTLGTDTPQASVWCPNAATTPLEGGTFGCRFATGIAYAITDNASTIPTAGGTITVSGATTPIVVNIRYT